MPIRVAFTGPAGSGKSTHAKLLQKEFHGEVVSFATPLKQVLADLYGEKMKNVQFAREAAQQIGDAARRQDVNVFVNKAIEKVNAGKNVFIDDLRYLNEMTALNPYGFIVIRLVAPLEVLQQRRPHMTADQLRHQSETENLYIKADITLSTDVFTIEEVQSYIRDYITSRVYERAQAEANA